MKTWEMTRTANLICSTSFFSMICQITANDRTLKITVVNISSNIVLIRFKFMLILLFFGLPVFRLLATCLCTPSYTKNAQKYSIGRGFVCVVLLLKKERILKKKENKRKAQKGGIKVNNWSFHHLKTVCFFEFVFRLGNKKSNISRINSFYQTFIF